MMRVRGIDNHSPEPPNYGAIVVAMEMGVLPCDGGLLDQPADFVDDLWIALGERDKMLSEMKEKHG